MSMFVEWPDFSQFNTGDIDNLPSKYRVVSIRANDGTYEDTAFHDRLAKAKHAVDRHRLDFFIVYLVFEPDWRQTYRTFTRMVGRPHPRMVVMIDVESWGGRITGDHSTDLNALRSALYHWLHKYHSPKHRPMLSFIRRDIRRIIGYGNAGDLRTIWRHRKRIHIILADYSESDAQFPYKIAQQYRSDAHIPGWVGNVDMNRADRSLTSLRRALGVN